MRLVARVAWVFVVVVLAIAGCNDVYTPPETATLELAVQMGAGHGENFRMPLEGVQLCETDTDNCELSDDRGRVTIELPVGPEISYTLEKEGYPSYLTPDVIGPGGFAYLRGLPTDDWMAQQYDRVGSPYPMRFTGTIIISTGGLAGATFDLVGATGTLFYGENFTGPDDEVTDFSLDRMETAKDGMAGFTEVTPGDEYHVNFGGTALGCVPDLAWPGNNPNSIRLPVREGFVTRASVRCPPPPP